MTDVRSRIVVDLVGEPASANSGIGRYVNQLANALRDASVDVEFCTFRYLPGARHRSVLTVLPIGLIGRRPGSIIHIPQSQGASVLLMQRLQPCVVTVHDLGAVYCPEDRPLFPRTGRALYNLSLRGMRRADHIIAVSEFTRGYVIRAGYDPDRVSVVHEGVDTRHFSPRANARAFLSEHYGIRPPAECPILLYVGNEQPRKNLATLIRALAALKLQGVAFHWVKVGRSGYPPGRTQLTKLIDQHSLRNQTTFVEDVPESDLPYFYSAADCYVQPSVWEGFGLPVLEAMACGAPVVSSTAGALPEVGAGATLQVDPMDAQGMAYAIAKVLHDDPVRMRMQELNRARVAQFHWSAAATQTRSIYATVMEVRS